MSKVLSADHENIQYDIIHSVDYHTVRLNLRCQSIPHYCVLSNGKFQYTPYLPYEQSRSIFCCNIRCSKKAVAELQNRKMLCLQENGTYVLTLNVRISRDSLKKAYQTRRENPHQLLSFNISASQPSLHVKLLLPCWVFRRELNALRKEQLAQKQINAVRKKTIKECEQARMAQIYNELAPYTIGYKHKKFDHRACEISMSGSPKGLDRVEPWMNSSNLETKPFEGGKCSPR